MPAPRVVWALVLVQVIFGVHYFATKLILELVPARAWAAMRITGAAVLLMAYNLAFLRQYPKNRADLGRLAVYALFGVVLNQVLFVEGLSRTTPSHSSVINSLIPVLTLAIALVARQERSNWVGGIAIGVSLSSVLVLLRVENLSFDDDLVTGDLLTLANASSFSLFLVLSRNYLRRTHPMAATSYLLMLGVPWIWIAGAGPLSTVDFSDLPGYFWVLAVYVIVFATAIAYFLNYYALRHTESSVVALFIYLQPPIATALSMLFLGERPGVRFWIAAGGIFVGIGLAIRSPAHWTARGPSGRREAKPPS